MFEVVNPERAVLAAGIMAAVGIAIFLFRNRRVFRRWLRGRYE